MTSCVMTSRLCQTPVRQQTLAAVGTNTIKLFHGYYVRCGVGVLSPNYSRGRKPTQCQERKVFNAGDELSAQQGAHLRLLKHGGQWRSELVSAAQPGRECSLGFRV